MDQLLPNVRRLAQQAWELVLMTSILVACVCLQSRIAGASTTDGTHKSVRFQVGPIVQDWNTGALADNGFLIEPTYASPSRDVAFDSSDRATHTGGLTVTAVDSMRADGTP